MKTDDKIVTFESYYDPMLAHIVRTRLEANGIQCFVADENTIGANPLYNQAVGGIKLKVFEEDIDRCREMLAADEALNEQDYNEIATETDNPTVCPYCASADVVKLATDDDGFASTLLNMVNPFYTPKTWHCNNCKQSFE